jgi:hypothetical protein
MTPTHDWLRRSVALGGVSLGSLATLASGTAHAGSNFGGWDDGFPFSSHYGGRVGIQTPPNATTETIASNEIMAHRIAVQGGSTFPGLIQTGLYRSGPNAHADNCDTSVDKYTWYVEILPASYPQTFKCALYGQSPFGHDGEYKVSGDGTGRFQASGADVQSGQTYTTPWVQLYFNAGQNYISTEMNNASPGVANGSTTNALFGGGAAADPSWYAYEQPNYGGAHRVRANEVISLSENYQSAGHWTEQPLPTPVRFTHTP